MSMFENRLAGVAPSPVGSGDPSEGFAEKPAKWDHKHQLAIPDQIEYDPVFAAGAVSTNITDTGVYWIEERQWINVEIGCVFTGALAAGTLSFSLPFPVAFPTGGLNAGIFLGRGIGVDTGLARYGFEVHANSDNPSTALLSLLGTLTSASNTSPWTMGNGDGLQLVCRYRRNPNI
jgi:hypothetical protein